MCIELDYYHCNHFVRGREISCQKGIGRDARSSKDVQTSRFAKSSKPVQAGTVQSSRAAWSREAVETSRSTKSSKTVEPSRSVESNRFVQSRQPVQSDNDSQPNDVDDDDKLTDSHRGLSNEEVDLRGLPSPGPSQVNRKSHGSGKQDSNEESVASDTTDRRLTGLITGIQPGSDELEDLYQKPSNERNELNNPCQKLSNEENVAQNVPSRRLSQVSGVSRANPRRDSGRESVASRTTSYHLSRIITGEGSSDREKIARDVPKRRRKDLSTAHCSGAFSKIDAHEIPMRRPSVISSRPVLHPGGRRGSEVDASGGVPRRRPNLLNRMLHPGSWHKSQYGVVSNTSRRRPSILRKATSSANAMGSNLANLMHNNNSTDSSMESFACIGASQQEARAAAAIPPRRPNRPLPTVSEGSRE
ncbi:hypothetical protein NQ176_g4377 [Zarea fungicola]|uniref:Uncharacterized protein n=1 Tax=Zarea fungicola TaxID=93591 RepID=A0ACC1NDS4_9HYPO|nr:hypothetical protein NQ176_g4377 [Lecanicillium fungicola]